MKFRSYWIILFLFIAAPESPAAQCASALVIGRPVGGGRDTAAEVELPFSHRMWNKLALTGEIHGVTRLNSAIPGFTSTLWALTCDLSPRLVVDAGMDTSLTPNAPFRKHFVMGFVYSVGELYPGLRRHLHQSETPFSKRLAGVRAKLCAPGGMH